MLFRQQALASENSANITPKQTEKVEASAEIAESSASTKNCPSTSAGVPSQCDDTHSNHDSSDDNQTSDGSQSTQDTCLVPDQRLFMSSKYERRYNWLYYSAAKGGYCCKICELFAQESDNIFIKGTTLGDHPTRKLERHLKMRFQNLLMSQWRVRSWINEILDIFVFIIGCVFSQFCIKRRENSQF